MSKPQGDSVWGNINTCFEIAINIYYIYAEYGEGIMVPKNEKSILSKNALNMGQEEDGYICFNEDTKDIPMYEILQSRMALCKRIENKTLNQMEEIKRDGKISLTDYFGECSPPPTKSEQVRNGIYMTEYKKKESFAVHEAIADNYLSPYALEFGVKDGDYFYYDTTTAAIPLSELQQIFSEVLGLILSKDSLYATLNSRFSSYVTAYNSILPDEDKIPQSDAPSNLYLASQIKEASKMRGFESQAEEHEDDYGEEVEGYGFEQ